MKRLRRRMEYPDELYHFGIKGMKWGVRKTRRAIDNGEGLIGKAIYNHRRKRRIKNAIKKGIDDDLNRHDSSIAKYGFKPDYSSKFKRYRIKRMMTGKRQIKQFMDQEDYAIKKLKDRNYKISDERYNYLEGGYFEPKNYRKQLKMRRGK